MDAIKFINERNRMCKSFGGSCNGCPADKNFCCDTFEWQERLVAIVEAWSTTHPRKTRQSELLKLYPETALDENGVISICPNALFLAYRNSSGGCNNPDSTCPDCRREFWSKEVK